MMSTKKVLALTLAFFATVNFTACGGSDKKEPAPAPQKKTETAKPAQQAKAPEVKKEDPAELHAREVMKLPEVAKYDKISKDAYPHLKWGSTGYYYNKATDVKPDTKGALLAYGEVQANFTRTMATSDQPKFKDKNGRDVKGDEKYRIEVLVGGCKGNCVIEAGGTHTKRTDPASYEKPVVEKKVLVPFDKTYIRHDENGKKWVTHEKCGTK